MQDDDKNDQVDPDDLAPDADVEGDTELPAELKGLVHKGKAKQDNVDQRELTGQRVRP